MIVFDKVMKKSAAAAAREMKKEKKERRREGGEGERVNQTESQTSVETKEKKILHLCRNDTVEFYKPRKK